MLEEPTRCCQPPGSGRGEACLSFLAVILVHLPGAVGVGMRQGLTSFLPHILSCEPMRHRTDLLAFVSLVVNLPPVELAKAASLQS